MFRQLLLILFLLCALMGKSNAVDTPVVYIVDLEFWGEKCGNSDALCGIYPEIFEELSRRMELPIRKVLVPYPRLIAGISNGSADFAISLPKEHYDSTYLIGVEVWRIQLGILSKDTITDLTQLRGKRVGTIRNAAFDEEFNSDTAIVKVPSVEHVNLLKMMKLGRIDAIASDLTILKGILQQRPDLQMNFAPQLLVNELTLHLIVSMESPFIQRIDELNEVLTVMKDDGTIQKIVLKYLK